MYKLQFIHAVKGDGLKTAKIIKKAMLIVNHTNIVKISMLVRLAMT